jgi:hypothetical protein
VQRFHLREGVTAIKSGAMSAMHLPYNHELDQKSKVSLLSSMQQIDALKKEVVTLSSVTGNAAQGQSGVVRRSQSQCAQREMPICYKSMTPSPPPKVQRPLNMVPCHKAFAMLHRIRPCPEEHFHDPLQCLEQPGRQPHADRCVDWDGHESKLDQGQLPTVMHQSAFPHR